MVNLHTISFPVPAQLKIPIWFCEKKNCAKISVMQITFLKIEILIMKPAHSSWPVTDIRGEARTKKKRNNAWASQTFGCNFVENVSFFMSSYGRYDVLMDPVSINNALSVSSMHGVFTSGRVMQEVPLNFIERHSDKLEIYADSCQMTHMLVVLGVVRGAQFFVLAFGQIPLRQPALTHVHFDSQRVFCVLVDETDGSCHLTPIK